jgi:hypothetical protein
MVSRYATWDLAMLRWIAYIKSLNPEIRHISRKDNAMADMLSRARFDNESGIQSGSPGCHGTAIGEMGHWR